jgi:hypothetical protein
LTGAEPIHIGDDRLAKGLRARRTQPRFCRCPGADSAGFPEAFGILSTYSIK